MLHNNIKVNVEKYLCFMGTNWMYLAENTDRYWTVVNTVMNILIPYNMGNFLASCTTVSFLT